MAKIAFTATRVAGLRCPPDKAQAFLWDVTAPGLGLRVTPAGKPAYVFQGEFHGKTVRVTIGGPAAWTIPQAQDKARELQRLIDKGIDPRTLKRDALAAGEAQKAADAAQVEADKAAALTVGEVWGVYLAERRPAWGDRHYQDHIDKAAPGGTPSTRRGYERHLTQPGPLAALMPLPLCDLDAATVEAWAAREGKTRPTSARLAWRLLKVFLRWCEEQPAYAGLLPPKNPAKTQKSREALGKAGVKKDVLQRGQLSAWFDAVRQIQNPAIAAALQVMLLTGARPGEVLSLRWEDVNTKWKGIAIRDKVEGTREIPATPYVLHLLAALPRRVTVDKKTGEKTSNPWIFSSASSADGRLTVVNNPHTLACTVAGLEGLTPHGLRRSFKSLTEWLEIPAGVVAQIMGHKPSATAEKHYTIRPLDLLRIHHEKIEAWVLEQAGVQFIPRAEPGRLALAT
jgi:integrase